MKQKWTLLDFALAFALACAASGAQAQSKDALYARGLAATCANCHGTNGKAIEGAVVPALAGMARDNLAAQMQAFKAGTRQSTVMQQIAKGYSDAQIEQLAAYFAAQKR